MTVLIASYIFIFSSFVTSGESATSISALLDHWACASASARPSIAPARSTQGIFQSSRENFLVMSRVYSRELPGLVVIEIV